MTSYTKGLSDQEAVVGIDSRAAHASLRVALLAWMVAGVRTQYENLRLVTPPEGVTLDTYAIVPYHPGGTIEGLPLLRSSQKGTLRSTWYALPLLGRPAYDAVWTQVTLPLLPLLAASLTHLKTWPPVVLSIDTTPALMDDFHEVYYASPSAGPLKKSMRDAFHRFILQRLAAVAPWSHWAARSFHRDYGVPEDRIKVIPPGVDLRQWTVPERRAVGRSQENSAPFRLLFVGADFDRKGGPLLVDVFRRNLRECCELHLVTKAEVDEEPGIHVYREFGPNEPGLRGLYGGCDAFVLPTQADCFSLASIEAMACGLPVVSCPVGGIPEIVDEGKTGFLIPPNDGTALLRSVESLMSDPSSARSMGLAGRKVVEERFDNERCSGALYELLQSVAQHRSAA